MSNKPQLRQLVDWSAALWAGGIAGLVFLLFNLFVTPLFGAGSAWISLSYTASVILGSTVLPPSDTSNFVVIIAGLAVHFALSIGGALLLAYIIHRWGLIIGIIGGALFGIALYLINFYTLTLIFPWFFAIRSWSLLINHVIFGAIAGGVYELLEVEEFVAE